MEKQARPHFGPTEIRGVVSLAITLVVMGIALFVPAGTLNWPRGWWFAFVFLVSILTSMAVLWRVNPEIFAARAQVSKGTPIWDYFIVAVIIVGFVAVLPVAALDDARFHWFPVPDWAIDLGYVLFIAGFAVTAWAQAVNRHFEPSVRVQSERGHTVIDTGPYASIRHPGYIAGSMLVVGMALTLGSIWALIPALVVVAVLVIRTLLEEQTLRAGLPGYTEYTARVRSRWIPGVW